MEAHISRRWRQWQENAGCNKALAHHGAPEVDNIQVGVYMGRPERESVMLEHKAGEIRDIFKQDWPWRGLVKAVFKFIHMSG